MTSKGMVEHRIFQNGLFMFKPAHDLRNKFVSERYIGRSCCNIIVPTFSQSRVSYLDLDCWFSSDTAMTVAGTLFY